MLNDQTIRKAVHKLVAALDRPGGRWAVAQFLPIYGRRTADGVRGLSYDRGWIHDFGDCRTVEPWPRLRSYHLREPTNRELWGYLYTPRPGDVVLDVGAHIGSETIYFAHKVGPRGRVISIEAHPGIFDFLRRSMEINQLGQVTCLNLAVSDKREQIFIQDNFAGEGFGQFLGNAITRDPASGVCVDAVTLDELCAEHRVDRIDYLKMNIEGAERPALIGMDRMIRKTKVVSISCHDFRPEDPFFWTRKFVRGFLKERGFVVVPREHELPEISDQVNAFNPELIERSELSA